MEPAVDDKPTLGVRGSPEDEPGGEAAAGSRGVILYPDYQKQPPPAGDLGDPEPSSPAPTDRGWMSAAIVLVMALAVAGGYVALEGLPGATRIDEDAALPPMMPSLIPGRGLSEAVTPLVPGVITGAVGTAVPVSMRASGAGGVPLADTVVVFRIQEGGGELEGTEARTDEDGVARTSLRLPSRPGRTLVVAGVAGSQIQEGSIAVDAVPGTPTSIAAVSGNGQTAGVGGLLPERPAIRVSDANGNPVPGVVISFRVRSGDGMAAPSQVRTDSLGRASALWRLGMEDGTQELAAAVPQLAAEVVFTALATPRTTPAPRDVPSTGIEVGPVSVRPSTLAMGGSHVCELELGNVVCRGASDRGQVSAEGEIRFVAAASGLSHVCGLDPEGIAFCWGGNERGQLGDGSLSDRSTPVRVRTELRFSSLAAGAAHTCGLAGGGIPACWGLNLSGQLGDGSRNDQRGPRTVGGGMTFRTLTAGWNHTCGLTTSGNAFCWGLNSQGQLGDGSRLDRLVPKLVRGSIETLAAGSAHTCGISEGRVLCWGANAFGQLGDGTVTDRPQPAEVTGLPSVPARLVAGAVHTCALTTQGQAYCWGQNLQGQLGDGTTENRLSAAPVQGGHTFRELQAGGAMTCGVTAGGVEYCWGLNGSGQLGDGSRVNRLTPTRVNR